MIARLMLLASTALATGLIAAGCGDDGEAEEALTKAGWIQKADQICRDANQDFEAAGKEFAAGIQGGQPTEDDLTSFVQDELIPLFNDELDKLDELPPPEGGEEEVDAIISAARDGADELEENPDLVLKQQDPEGIQEANRLAKDYGLEVCGQA